MDRRLEFAIDHCWYVNMSSSVSNATLTIAVSHLVLSTSATDPGARVSTCR
jgi:hypothetical protein